MNEITLFVQRDFIKAEFQQTLLNNALLQTDEQLGIRQYRYGI